MNTRSLALAAILIAPSCTSVALTRPPANDLERSVIFREAAADGWHGISSEDPISTAVMRIIDPADVDAESRIEALPDADQLATAALALGGDPERTSLRLEAWIERPGSDPVPLHLPGYDALDELDLRATPRALGDTPPTALDLTRTMARQGSRVLVRAVLEDQSGVQLGEAHESRFRIEQMGWYSAYHPSVVLAKPGYSAASEANFRFTPGIAWLHSYRPRPDEQGHWQDWMRATKMSIGPHAMLLQFDSEDEVEVGLGVTAGFWGGVLQLGFGYNLMADGGQDRQYLYIGSSMISLAQAADRSFGALSGW